MIAVLMFDVNIRIPHRQPQPDETIDRYRLPIGHDSSVDVINVRVPH